MTLICLSKKSLLDVHQYYMNIIISKYQVSIPRKLPRYLIIFTTKSITHPRYNLEEISPAGYQRLVYVISGVLENKSSPIPDGRMAKAGGIRTGPGSCSRTQPKH
jgi:hypothetical protein